ncbi:MAG: porin [Gemmatales bacterium]
MVSSFRRKWPTFMKYAAIGFTAFIFSAAPVSAQDAKQQQIDALKAQVEAQGQQIQKLLQLVEHQKSLPAVVPVEMQPPSTASQPEDVRKVVEKVLKEKDDAKKADDEKKKREAADKGHEVGSDLKMSANWDKGPRFETAEKDFTAKIGGRINYDTVFWNASDRMQLPGSPSVNPTKTGVGAGVGQLDDGMFIRRARIEMVGTFYEQFEYQFEVDFETLNVISYDHVWVGMKDVPGLGTIRVGQQKVPMVLESYSSSKNLMFLERSCLFDAFWNEFAPGIYFTNTMFEERATWHAMLHRIEFNNPASGGDFGDGDYAVTGRVTALPWYENDGRCLVHVGASYQWRRADLGRTTASTTPAINAYADQRGVVIFRDRPELRDAVGSGANAEGDSTRFVSTGNIIADNVQTVNGEFLAIQGPLTIQSEITAAQVANARYPATAANTNRGTPEFWGMYAEVGYCLTGENRGYDRRFGSVGTIKPYEPVFAVRDEDGCYHSGSGAWELCYRFSFLDLNDTGSNILGGRLTENTVGINWWLTQNMRLQANYLNIYRDVPSPATTGTVHALGLRAIVEF